MNDQIAYQIAEHMQRLADAFEVSLRPQLATIDDVVTMRDRFALMIVASSEPWPFKHGEAWRASTSYAQQVYDLADALDAERKRRNAADAAKSDAGDGE